MNDVKIVTAGMPHYKTLRFVAAASANGADTRESCNFVWNRPAARALVASDGHRIHWYTDGSEGNGLPGDFAAPDVDTPYTVGKNNQRLIELLDRRSVGRVITLAFDKLMQSFPADDGFVPVPTIGGKRSLSALIGDMLAACIARDGGQHKENFNLDYLADAIMLCDHYRIGEQPGRPAAFRAGEDNRRHCALVMPMRAQ